MFKEAHYEQFITLEKDNFKAVLGCGHFVCTVRSQVFEKGPKSPTLYKMGGKVMANYIDKPNRDSGYLRLATLDNYAFHIGNTMEDWIATEIEKLKNLNHEGYQINEKIDFKVKPYSKSARWMSKVIFKIFIKTSFGKRLFLKHVGIKSKDY